MTAILHALIVVLGGAAAMSPAAGSPMVGSSAYNHRAAAVVPPVRCNKGELCSDHRPCPPTGICPPPVPKVRTRRLYTVVSDFFSLGCVPHNDVDRQVRNQTTYSLAAVDPAAVCINGAAASVSAYTGADPTQWVILLGPTSPGIGALDRL